MSQVKLVNEDFLHAQLLSKFMDAEKAGNLVEGIKTSLRLGDWTSRELLNNHVATLESDPVLGKRIPSAELIQMLIWRSASR